MAWPLLSAPGVRMAREGKSLDLMHADTMTASKSKPSVVQKARASSLSLMNMMVQRYEWLVCVKEFWGAGLSPFAI